MLPPAIFDPLPETRASRQVDSVLKVAPAFCLNAPVNPLNLPFRIVSVAMFDEGPSCRAKTQRFLSYCSTLGRAVLSCNRATFVGGELFGISCWLLIISHLQWSVSFKMAFCVTNVLIRNELCFNGLGVGSFVSSRKQKIGLVLQVF